MTVFGTPDNPEYFAYVCEQITDSIQHLEQQLCEVQAYITTGKGGLTRPARYASAAMPGYGVGGRRIVEK